MQNNCNTHTAGTIRCPKCSHDFALTDGLVAEAREELVKEFETEREEILQQVSAREAEISEKARAVDAQKATIESSIADGVKNQLESIREAEARKAADKHAVEMLDLQKQLEEKGDALKQAQSAELEIRKRQRELEAAKESMDLEVSRKLDAERSKIQESASKKADEQNQFRIAEKDKKITDLLKQVDEMKRKAEQGSVQLQGEVLELSLEDELIEWFPQDQIDPVPKGVRGADVVQTVVSPSHRQCGTIIFETKRTKRFGSDWIAKLKKDQLSSGAQIAVIISQALPEEVDGFGQIDGVWVCDYSSAIALTTALRFTLIEVSREKLANEGRTEKAEVLYSYITGTEFRQRIEAIVNHFTAMKTSLDKERTATERLWAKRETQILEIQRNIASMFGSMEAIAGKALPEVKVLQLEDEAA